jgi:hypothetical protein
VTNPAVAGTPAHQLDLFLDGRDAILVHDIVTSLVARDLERVATGLAQLQHEHPAHPDLSSLTLLASSLQAPLLSAPTPAALTARIDELERRVAPAGRRYLGADAAAFLRPAWEMLAARAATLPFESTHPRAHPGWLCQQYGDWGAVRTAIAAEPDWTTIPLLRYWMSLARHHLGEPEAALCLWLSLCWMDPALFVLHAPTFPSAPVRDAWTAFERTASFEEQTAEATDTAAWFPAWLLVRHPGLANLFRTEEVPEAGAATRAFRVLLSLLPLEREGLTQDVVSQRRALQSISPGFFHHYLEVVSRRRAGL